MEKIKNELFTTKNIATIALLTAVSFILYMFAKFNLPFVFPGFLEMQFSDMPALLGGFAIGPWAGGIIIVLKCLLKMPFSSTACVGEFADIIVGLAFVIPSTIFYKFHRTKKGAIISLLIGVLSAVCFSLIANRFILVPFFAKEYGMDAVVGMMKSLFPNITSENIYAYYLPASVLPFNFLRCLICSLITYFVYKPVARALRWERTKTKQDKK